MRDFTLRTYKELLKSLETGEYECLTVEQYCAIRQGIGERKALPERYVIMRHDVDKRPWFAVEMAELEAQMGIKASYYFRIGKESNNPECIKRIAALGHEIGYHYEDMSLCGGDYEKAYAHFKEALEYFRQFYPVRTCCMHGAPTSKYDSRALWEKYDYHDLQIIGEPYYDVDFSKVVYLTDTGRCWDGFQYSLRDKIPEQQQRWINNYWTFHYTWEIVIAMEDHRLPAVLFTTHPQRWTNKWGAWMKELFEQNFKNMIKGVLSYKRGD
ncbi:MAG: hypothetical protein J6T76_06120 [Paludibacteraceae bacterium]|nr:hypothetical protein [Paludibacteraceae bacterium]